MKSLKSLCEEKIIKSPIEVILESYAILRQTSYSIDFIQNKCFNYLKDRFALLHERYDQESLIDALGESSYLIMKSEYDESIQARKIIRSYKGEKLENNTLDSELYNSRDGFYSYEALKSGVVWPENVDCTKRESYLSEDDFEKIFSVSKVRFYSLSKHIQIRLKKEKKLF